MKCYKCDKELDYIKNIHFEEHKYHRECFSSLNIEEPYFKRHVPSFVDADIGVFKFKNQDELLKKIGEFEGYHFVKGDKLLLMAMKDDKSEWWFLGGVYNFELDLPSFKAE